MRRLRKRDRPLRRSRNRRLDDGFAIRSFLNWAFNMKCVLYFCFHRTRQTALESYIVSRLRRLESNCLSVVLPTKKPSPFVFFQSIVNAVPGVKSAISSSTVSLGLATLGVCVIFHLDGACAISTGIETSSNGKVINFLNMIL